MAKDLRPDGTQTEAAINVQRRAFLRFLAASPLLASPLLAGPLLTGSARALTNPADPFADAPFYGEPVPRSAEEALNVFQLRDLAVDKIHPDSWRWLSTGVDDGVTLRRNEEIFRALQLRIRRLIDVRDIDTSVEIFGERYASPIFLAPIGIQNAFHPEGELPTARAAGAQGHRMIAATLTSASFEDITAATMAFEGGAVPWFQLYARWDRSLLADLLQRVEAAGCPAVALTVDTPVGGNREPGLRGVVRMVLSGRLRFGNIADEDQPLAPTNPGLSWEFVDWLRAKTRMKVLIKGILTTEDTRLAREHGCDGVIVSTHGGRQGPGGRSSLEALPEVLDAMDGAGPVLIDSGFRRGTDVFKALALGANAVCLGRPQIWGLGAFGQAGVEQVLALLQGELVRAMRFAGTTTRAAITRATLEAPPGSPFAS